MKFKEDKGDYELESKDCSDEKTAVCYHKCGELLFELNCEFVIRKAYSNGKYFYLKLDYVSGDRERSPK